jgi:hypothetical protein
MVVFSHKVIHLSSPAKTGHIIFDQDIAPFSGGFSAPLAAICGVAGPSGD